LPIHIGGDVYFMCIPKRIKVKCPCSSSAWREGKRVLSVYPIIIFQVSPIRRSINITLNMPARIPKIEPSCSTTKVRRTTHRHGKSIRPAITITKIIATTTPI